MCAIAGIVTLKGDHDVSLDLYNMLESMKHRGPDGSGCYVNGQIIHDSLIDLKVPKGSFGLGHNLLSIVGKEVSQPIEKHGLILVANAEVYNYRELKKCCNDEYKTDSDCEVIISIIKKFYNGSLSNAVKKAVHEIDGDYAFAIYDGIELVVIRDALGVKPVYYGSDDDKTIFAFASEKKALWKVGITNIHTLKPHHLLTHNMEKNLSTIKNLEEFKENITNFKATHSNQPIGTGKSYYKSKLMNALIDSVSKRVNELSEVGIIFSGGIDSTILAKISQDLGVKTKLYTVGTENSVDIKFAKKTAKYLDLPIEVKILKIPDVKKYTEFVLNAIEEFNIMKIGVGIPSYAASEMARDDNIKVMLSGQGADELFGGYNRYIQFYKDKGELAQEDLKSDVSNLYHVNLQRDDAVTMANSVELRVPYLDQKLVEIAMNIPMQYKIYNEDENLRKCILREVASDLEVPQDIVRRPKKAAQYGSGVHKILVKKILKDEKYKTKLETLYKT
jgi:asparagine synthase (glutamine-hydrolysing)